ncbi:MAG: glycosyl transferase, partial [Cereibacter changlensis]
AFLTSLIWNTRGERQCFQFGPGDRQDIARFFAADPNAQVSVISGAWAVPLFRSRRPVAEIRKQAAWLQKVESGHLTMLGASWVKARVRVWRLAEFIESPMEPLQTLMDEISPRALRRLTEAPRLVDLTGFDQFLHGLRNEGMKPVLIGDYPARGEAAIARRRQPLLAGGS